MTTSYDDSAAKGPGHNQHANKQSDSASTKATTGKEGHYYNHPHWGRVKVVALFCDCGRSILVKSTDTKDASILCDRCNSAFRWQQLSFAYEI